MSKLKLTARGQKLCELLEKRIVFLDGAMGTMVQRRNLKDEDFRGNIMELVENQRRLAGNNDLLNLTRPDVIRDIHMRYFIAGADICTSNTFGANSLVQSEYGISAELTRRINVEGIRLIREAADEAKKRLGGAERDFFAAASLGPMNKSASIAADVDDPSVRAVSFDILQEAYLEQIEALWDAGADLFIIETSFDTLNVKAALHAYMTVCEKRGERIPIGVSMTVSDASGRILSGQTISAFYASIRHADPLFVGLNCSLGAEKMRPYIEEFDRVAECYTHCYPNAGLPNPFSETGYDQTPDMVASTLSRYAGEGLLNIIGGCCGTSPEHIAAIRKSCEIYSPRVPRRPREGLVLSGLETFVMEDSGAPFAFVGERTNVMGSPAFRKAVKEGRFDDALNVARNQVANGANIIDVNFDEGMLDGSACMTKFLNLMGSDPEVSRVPVMIDSSNWKTLLAGLKCIQGKGIVNSISLKEGERAFLEKAGEIKKFGAAVIVMAFDEDGQASDFDSRVRICSRAYKILVEKAGFDPEDIIFDPNVLTVGTGMAEHAGYAIDYINAVRELKRICPKARVSGGISNVSFAFRGNNVVREAMHSVFLYHARRAGLDMGIVNAGMLAAYDDIDPALREAVEAVILNTSADASEKLLALADSYKGASASHRDEHSADDATATWEMRLERAFVKGQEDKISEIVRHYLEELKDPLKVIEVPLMSAMKKVGELFGAGKMFLPQVVKSARVMKRAVAELEPLMGLSKGVSGPKIVLATVKGDVHDIGKNIVAAVLACNGYSVVDVGVMAEAEKILEAAKDAQIVGLSGLITPSLDEMAHTIEVFERAGMRVPIMVGGAATGALHTAVKLAPLYSGTVVRVGDASLSAGVCAALTSPKRDIYALKIADEQSALRKDYEESRSKEINSAKLVPLAEARLRRAKFEFAPKKAPFFGVETFDVGFDEIEKILPWGMYFRAWSVSNEKRGELDDFYGDTRAVLSRLAELAKLKVRVGFYESVSSGEDIEVYEKGGEIPCEVLNTVRTQIPSREGVCASIADFVAPKGGPRRDVIALFAATVGKEADDFVGNFAKEGDSYSQMIAKNLCDMVAESLSRYVQLKFFAPALGIANARGAGDLAASGIRAAVGYPSYPDHAQKLKFEKLLSMRDSVGISLTGSYMMTPQSSVCALWIGNPAARYIDAKIAEDQIADFCARTGRDSADASRNMAASII